MPLRLTLAFACALLGACGRPGDATVTVDGRLLGHDGQPMRAAWVAVQGMGTHRRVPVDAAGNLSFEVTSPGCYFIWLVGVHHRSLFRPLFVDEHRRIRFEAHLATAPYVEPFDSVRVIGAFNDFSATEGSVPLRRQSDGTFAGTFAATSDTFAYRLVGVQDDCPIEGTDADRFIVPPRTMLYSGHAGGFVSVLGCSGDSVRVTFDPAALPRAADPAVLRFDDPMSHAARIAAVDEEFDRRTSRASDFVRAREAAGDDPRTISYDWESDRREVRAMIEREGDPTVRQALLVGYFERLAPLVADSLLARRVFAEVAPTSPIWSLVRNDLGGTLFTLNRSAGQPTVARGYALQAVDQNPDREVSAAFLLHEVQLSYAAMQRERSTLASSEDVAATAAEMEFAVLYARLEAEFSDSGSAQRAKLMMGPTRAIQPGKPVPDFALKALGDSTTTYTPETFRGRPVLLDFWAVWCGPCRYEIPNLEAAYTKYASRGLTILSISFDPTEHDVEVFRRERSPMPWLHCHVRKGFRSDIAERFEVYGIPRTVLVSETGTILAVDLRGERLEEKLASLFDPR